MTIETNESKGDKSLEMIQKTKSKLATRRTFLKAAGATGVVAAMYTVPKFSSVHARPAYASITGVPSCVLVWDQDFATGADGWFDGGDFAGFGTITDNGDGTAQMEGSARGPFSRFDGYRDTWPGSWTAEIDVYLDPNWDTGQGFDYSVAANGSDGLHQRDYIFHVGVVEGEVLVPGKALLVNGSNNADFFTNPFKLINDNSGNFYEVTTAGWYTLRHVFYDAGGHLAVDLKLVDAGGTVLWTATRETVTDTIPGEVGGNRYGWFTHIDVVGGIQVDNHQLCIVGFTNGLE